MGNEYHARNKGQVIHVVRQSHTVNTNTNPRKLVLERKRLFLQSLVFEKQLSEKAYPLVLGQEGMQGGPLLQLVPTAQGLLLVVTDQ